MSRFFLAAVVGLAALTIFLCLPAPAAAQSTAPVCDEIAAPPPGSADARAAPPDLTSDGAASLECEAAVVGPSAAASDDAPPIAVAPLTPPALLPQPPSRAIALAPSEPVSDRFRWGPALEQSLLFLAVQHGYRMTEDKTRRFLPGPFFKDWFGSVKNLGGWDDKGSVFGNYVAHPMQGAVTGYIYVQNSPSASRQEFGRSREYWTSRLKAMGWMAMWSTQFELGPVSQASIGNVGLGPNDKKMAFVDLVVTPAAGMGWMVLEDAVDRKILQKLEARTNNRVVRNLARMGLTPMRACANILRFKLFWYRDTR